MKKTLLIILLLTITIGVKGKSDSLEITKISNRLKYLEDYKINIKEYYEAKNQELKNEQAKFENTYLQEREWWHLIIAFILGGSVSFVYLKRKFNEMVEVQLKPLFEGKSELMQSIIDKYDKELLIRREKKILIVSSNRNQYVYSELKTTFKRDNITEEIFNNFDNDLLEKIKNFDLVVFDNLQELIKENPIEMKPNSEFLRKIPNSIKVFVYKVQINDLSILERVGSATLPTQLIPNIMNLLKYN